jgi:hypothetical protein
MLSKAEHITQTEGFERGKYRMKNRITKLLALFMAAAIVFSLAACGKDKDNTTTAAVTTAVGETTAQGDTTANAETTANDATTVPGDTTAVDGTTIAAAVKKPESKEEILAAYTAVMNKAKTDKPGYSKYEYQALPENERNIGGAVKYLLPLAEMFMTKEDKAKSNAEVNVKGGNMNGFPVKKSAKGCLVTDPGVIKTATCEVLSNGNYKIVIVLNEETNPEPLKDGQTKAAGTTGNMFTPLGKSDIDKELTTNSTVKNVVKSADYSMLYRNSKTTLEYNPNTSQVVSVDQYMNIFLTLSGKIIILGTSSGTAVLEMFYKAYDFKY